VVVDGPQCSLESQAERVWIACTANSLITPLTGYQHIKIRNGDEPALDILVARSWKITSRLSVRRLVLVALETIEIDGALSADGGGGIWSSIRPTPPQAGPGGGAAGDPFSVGAGGGSFCGLGGRGSPNPLGRSAAYGGATLIPALGGSAGGTAGPGAGGNGGGFLQLVAGTSIVVGPAGKVTAGGFEGWDGGSGGGSGGGLLLEAPLVRIQGALTANGGGGGGPINGPPGHGEPARADATPAAGGIDAMSVRRGGNGGAGPAPDGEDALTGGGPAGGGGGVGRIRINTTAAAPEISGVVSPSPSTPCTTFGPLNPLP
jgi:hypothetical protein